MSVSEVVGLAFLCPCTWIDHRVAWSFFSVHQKNERRCEGFVPWLQLQRSILMAGVFQRVGRNETAREIGGSGSRRRRHWASDPEPARSYTSKSGRSFARLAWRVATGGRDPQLGYRA